MAQATGIYENVTRASLEGGMLNDKTGANLGHRRRFGHGVIVLRESCLGALVGATLSGKIGHDFHQNERGRTRYTISPTFRREILRRLLALNLEIAARESRKAVKI